MEYNGSDNLTRGDGVRLNRSKELMTPGCREAPGAFCFRGSWRRKGSEGAYIATRRIWCCGNAGAVRSRGFGTAQIRLELPVWNAQRESGGVFSAGAGWEICAKSCFDFAGLAHRFDGGTFWGVHDVLDIQLGNNSDVRGRRMDEGNSVRGGERTARVGCDAGGDSAGRCDLGGAHDARAIRRRAHVDANTHWRI